MNENDDLVNGRWSINLYAAIDYNFYTFNDFISRAAHRAARLKRNGSKKCAYGVCPNKWQGDDKKVGQKYQN